MCVPSCTPSACSAVDAFLPFLLDLFSPSTQFSATRSSSPPRSSTARACTSGTWSVRRRLALFGRQSGSFVLLFHPPRTRPYPLPLYRSTGDNWPAGGELDLVEYVNRQSYSSSSVHTSAGCYAGSTGYSGTQMLSGSEGLNCDAEENSAQGCGFRDANNNTAGIGTSPFSPHLLLLEQPLLPGNFVEQLKLTNAPSTGANYHKDGVYALLWDSDGIKTWFFPRADIPSDITRCELLSCLSGSSQPLTTVAFVVFVVQQEPRPVRLGHSDDVHRRLVLRPVHLLHRSDLVRLPTRSAPTYLYSTLRLCRIINTQLCGTWAGSASVWGADNSFVPVSPFHSRALRANWTSSAATLVRVAPAPPTPATAPARNTVRRLFRPFPMLRLTGSPSLQPSPTPLTSSTPTGRLLLSASTTSRRHRCLPSLSPYTPSQPSRIPTVRYFPPPPPILLSWLDRFYPPTFSLFPYGLFFSFVVLQHRNQQARRF